MSADAIRSVCTLPTTVTPFRSVSLSPLRQLGIDRLQSLDHAIDHCDIRGAFGHRIDVLRESVEVDGAIPARLFQDPEQLQRLHRMDRSDHQPVVERAISVVEVDTDQSVLVEREGGGHCR